MCLRGPQVEQLREIKWLSVTLIIFLYLEGQETYLSFFSILLGAKPSHLYIHHPNTFKPCTGPKINEVAHLGGINLLRLALQMYANTFVKFESKQLNVCVQRMS